MESVALSHQIKGATLHCNQEGNKVKKKSFSKEKGQLSVFLAIALLGTLSLMAFVINVGLFVKAKINLQNAVDAAAWSGAAVQARQLTNIAHVNWEIRNTYKEWMFKYYMLGNISLADGKLNSLIVNNTRNGSYATNETASYRKKALEISSNASEHFYDKLNVPSVCLKEPCRDANCTDICLIAGIPGLPRFETVDLVNVTETNRTFIDTMVTAKADACSRRSMINYGIALSWTYSTGEAIFQDIPIITPGKKGAWIESLELGLRMRNLESLVNREPVPGPICLAGAGCINPNSLKTSGQSLPINERPLKAYFAAWRNLAGGADKNNTANDSQFARTFSLTEIAPRPHHVSPNDLSGFLIPNTDAGNKALKKYYLDLQIYPINYAILFSTFSSKDGSFNNTVTQGSCSSVRTALPVPSYIFGFVKNPDVLTYYAVKGKAKFIGMFYPFQDRSGIELSAYAAAKPFGGRIGPRIFDIKQGAVYPRESAEVEISSPYISGIDRSLLQTLNPDDIQVIPTDDSFWLTNESSPIGGVPNDGDVKFIIPNLLYDIPTGQELSDIPANQKFESGLEFLTESPSSTSPATETRGLYNNDQAKMFINNLQGPDGPSYTTQNILDSIAHARAPTRYEAANYLIPTQSDDSDSKFFSSSKVKVTPSPNTKGGKYRLYAPIFGENSLYGEEVESIITVVESFLKSTQGAIFKYLRGLNTTAINIRNAAQANGGNALYDSAAARIHPVVGDGTPGGYDPGAAASIYENELLQDPVKCGTPDGANLVVSLAARYWHFFLNSSGGELCNSRPLTDLIREMFTRLASDSDFRNFYHGHYTLDNSKVGSAGISSGFYPTTYQGVLDVGNGSGPVATSVISPPPGLLVKRNFYSTKFMNISKVLDGPSREGLNRFDQVPSLLEKELLHGSSLPDSRGIQNHLPAGELYDEFKSLRF